MEKYNYYEAVKEDVLQYIRENINFADYSDIDELSEKLFDDCWIDDGVTGNASGSYYCNSWKAEEALAHNWDLLAEALREFGGDCTNILDAGAEAMDVTIRCYVLSSCIDDALDEIEEEFDEAQPE